MATRRRRTRRTSTRKGGRRITARRAYVPTRRRRRVSGTGFEIEKIAGLMIGGIAAKYVGGLLPAGTAKTIAEGAKIAAGVAIPMIAKGKTKKFLSAVGDGMIVDGATGLVSEFAPGVFSGIGQYAIDTNMLAGTNAPMLAGGVGENAQATPMLAGLGKIAATLGEI